MYLIESKTIQLINIPNLTSKSNFLYAMLLILFSSCVDIISVSAPDNCLTCTPLALARPRRTRQATVYHDHGVAVADETSRAGCCDICFFPSIAKLWSSSLTRVFSNNQVLPPFEMQAFYSLIYP